MNPLRLIASALLVAIIASPAAARAQSVQKQDSLSLARQYTSWLYSSQVDSLFAYASDDAKAVVKSAKAFEEPILELTARAGIEQEVLEEKFVTRHGRLQYWRTARFSNSTEPLTLRFALNERGEITGLSLRPRSAAPAVDTK